MNFIESVQKKYLPGFYQSRYTARKRLALSVKEKCLKNPSELTLYQLRIVLKVLEQYGLLSKDSALVERQKQLRNKILENSVYSGLATSLPFGVREFYRIRFFKKIIITAGIFCGVDYCLMHPYFKAYVAQCQRVAKDNISKLFEESKLQF